MRSVSAQHMLRCQRTPYQLRLMKLSPHMMLTTQHELTATHCNVQTMSARHCYVQQLHTCNGAQYHAKLLVHRSRTSHGTLLHTHWVQLQNA